LKELKDVTIIQITVHKEGAVLGLGDNGCVYRWSAFNDSQQYGWEGYGFEAEYEEEGGVSINQPAAPNPMIRETIAGPTNKDHRR
jgi:hypothetical protein